MEIETALGDAQIRAIVLVILFASIVPLKGRAASFEKVVDTNTAIPEGVGNFNDFSEPYLSAGNVAFWATGTGGQVGVYSIIGGVLDVVADTSTAAPGGGGNFTDFNFSSVSLHGNNVVFIANGPGGPGVYRRQGAGAIEVVAETGTTMVPGGGGEVFTDVGFITSIFGGLASFGGFGDAGTRGVYTWSGGPLNVVADTTDLAPPDFTLNFTSMGSPAISAGNVAFEGYATAARRGVYRSAGGALSAVADNNTLIPGEAVNFVRLVNPSISGSSVAFLGDDDLLDPKIGVYSAATGILTTAANLDTLIPDGGGATFLGLGRPSISGGKIAFSGAGLGGHFGIYIYNIGGSLTKLVDENDTLDAGRTTSTLVADNGAMSGNQVAFNAWFTDGLRAIYVADLFSNEDGDGIADAIDGTWDGQDFTDHSAIFSDSFTDQHLGGTSSGTILDRTDLYVEVTDLANPAGVRLEISSGGGTAVVDTCGIETHYVAGNVAEMTCTSLTLAVVSGPVTAELGPDVFVTVPSGVTVGITDLGGGEFEVEHLAGTEPIIVDVQGMMSEIDPDDPPLIVTVPPSDVVFAQGFED